MIHKEGYKIIIVVILLLVALNIIVNYFSENKILNSLMFTGSTILLVIVIWFFRNPNRKITQDDNIIFSPADGKIVLIDKVFDNEYFKSEMTQVSIFMSPLNVHVNYYPINGEIKYVKYYPGKYLVAWHPKSSEKNERSVIAIENKENKSVLVKQIAGAVARRVVTYAEVGNSAVQGNELGFIKFGSRVDLLLPLETKLNVKIGDKVKGKIHKIGYFK